MSKTLKTKTQLSVENGIKGLKTAVKKRLSLAEASRNLGKGRNYLSDIKNRLKDNYAKKNVDKDTYKQFNTLLKEYNKL